MGRREGPSEERRSAILAAAEAVFTERGFRGAAIREIARRAGVSSALLYWFFPDKAALFAAVLAARAEGVGIFTFPPALLDLPPDVFLPRLAGAFAALMTTPEQVNLVRLVLHENAEAPELVGALRETVLNRLLDPLQTYFSRQMELGRVRRASPEYLAQAFMGMFVTFVLRREIMQEPVSRAWPVAEYVEAAVQLFLHGLLRAPGEDLPEVAVAAAPPPPNPAARRRMRITLDEE